MNYPTELQQKMAAASTYGAGSIIGTGALAQHDAVGQMPQRDRPPVDVSAQRLFERLEQLHTEVALLTERLAPVTRPELTGEGKATVRGPTECQLVEMLDQAAERVEHAITRLASARNRLCI